MPSVTAGLKWPPETCPPAYTITMSAAPMAIGATTPAPVITVQAMVRTKKKVPTNSATYLFMASRLLVPYFPPGTGPGGAGRTVRPAPATRPRPLGDGVRRGVARALRSEERRVGKE